MRTPQVRKGSQVGAQFATFVQGETAYVTYSYIATNLIRLFSTVILTRILSPDDFGAISIVTSVIVTVTMLSDVGFNPFVIRHSDAFKKSFTDTVWTIRLARSIFLSSILFLIAGPVAEFMNKPELINLIRALSVVFIFEALPSMAWIIAVRERRLAKIATVDVAGALVQLASMVIFALVFKSYWAVVPASIVTWLFKIFMSYRFFPNSSNRIHCERIYAKELLNFAKFVAPSSAITLLLSQSDKIVLARLMPIDQYGLYMIAFSLAYAPLGFVGSYASRILYPRYADVWRSDPEGLPAAYYATRRKISLLYQIGCGILVGAAPLIIEILYDARYSAAGFYLVILASGSLTLLENTAAREALIAAGRVNATLAANIIRLSWLIVAAPAGYFLFGIPGMLVGFVSIEAAALMYNYKQLISLSIFSLKETALLLAASTVGIVAGACAYYYGLPLIERI
jgi:lipopolysaccharide exporter